MSYPLDEQGLSCFVQESNPHLEGRSLLSYPLNERSKSTQTDLNRPKRCCRPLRPPDHAYMAARIGFEPADAGVKVLCLCRLATGLCAGSAYGVRRAVWFTATPAKLSMAPCPVTVCPVCGIFFLREASLPLSHQPGAARHMGRRGLEPRSYGLRVRCNLRYTNGPDIAAPAGLEPAFPESESGVLSIALRSFSRTAWIRTGTNGFGDHYAAVTTQT